MFLPNIHCVFSSSQYNCAAVPVWSPSPLHSGPLQGPSCTGSPLRSACRGPSRSRSAQSLPPSAETPSKTQTHCAAFFPAHLKKMDCNVVKSYQWKWIPCDLTVLWKTLYLVGLGKGSIPFEAHSSSTIPVKKGLKYIYFHYNVCSSTSLATYTSNVRYLKAHAWCNKFGRKDDLSVVFGLQT